jgi:tetratricopeptide (TPR) repeat protein
MRQRHDIRARGRATRRLVRALAPAVLLALSLGPLAIAAQPGDGDERQSLQELLARLRQLRDERLGELQSSVDAVLRAIDIEARTRHVAGLEEQKRRLCALGPEVAPLLVDQIDPGENAEDVAILRAATVTAALVDQPSPAITARLVEIVRGGTPRGRLHAARVLAASPDVARASEALAELATSPQSELRRTAFVGLARLGGPASAKALDSALKSPDPKSVQLALEGLAEARAVAFAPQVLALASVTHQTTPYVASILGYYRACPEIVDKAHVQALVAIAGEIAVGNELRAKVLEFLPRFADKFDADIKKELRQLANSPTREIREGALVTLVLGGDRNARRDLVSDYDDQIDRNKSWPASFEARANVLYRIGEYRDAIRDYQKSLSLSANDFRARREDCYVGLARCYAQQGKLKDASQTLEKAPISRKQLAELASDPVFQKVAEHRIYGKVFQVE